MIIPLYAQETDYWDNAKVGEIKIYTISFYNSEDGKAESPEGDILVTSDAGNNWVSEINMDPLKEPSNPEIFWKADIYCAIMKTTDGGKTWLPYQEEKQEHFCGVYLRDDNTNYSVANHFLNKVTNEINEYSKNDKIDLLENKPIKCSEYYRNMNEGWAIGWCLKNYKKSQN